MENKFGQKEKQILVTTISFIVIFCFYAIYVYRNSIAGNPEIINDFKFWGKSFLFMIPIIIAMLILIHILFAIINKIVTNEDIPTLTDEMDKLIDLKALRISRWVYSSCFILAMVSQAIGMQPWVMMAILIFSCFAGALAEGIAKIYFYRKGV